MKYQEIMTKGNYSLILRKNNLDEYAVVHGLNKENGTWNHTVSYWNFCEFSSLDQAKALSYAIDCFREKTEENYIIRPRLEELATKFKDVFFEVCAEKEVADEYFYDNGFELTESEKEWFGIDDEENEYEWQDDSEIGCSDCPDDECTGRCMSCSYRPI